VPASVIKAGLTPHLVDVDPLTLDAAPGQLEAIAGAPVLALIATNLYGLPNDLPAWSRAAARAGAFLIDDAAQAMGASVGGRASGTWGDAGLYSLDKGKNISAIDGGLLVTRSELVGRELERDWRAMRSPSHGTIAKDLAKVLAYAALLPPAVYWIPRSVPQLGLGTTPFTTDFPVDHLPAPLAALALTMLPRLATYNATRASHARELIAGLAGLDGVQVPAPVTEATGVYLRLPVIVDPPALRARVLEALGRQGIGATGSYPTSLADVPALRPHLANPDAAFPGARYVADRIVTLPTHPYVGRRDLARTIDAMHTALAGRPTPGTR
jgi:dTDP-4-amino-4,6-dideoxygalactose transaminase